MKPNKRDGGYIWFIPPFGVVFGMAHTSLFVFPPFCFANGCVLRRCPLIVGRNNCRLSCSGWSLEAARKDENRSHRICEEFVARMIKTTTTHLVSILSQ